MHIEIVREIIATWHEAFDAAAEGNATRLTELIAQLADTMPESVKLPRLYVYERLGWVAEAHGSECLELMGPIQEWEFEEFREELAEL